MTATDYITYTALFAFILTTQLGTRRPTLDRLILPVMIVVGIGFKYLRNLPSGSTSHLLEFAGLGAGVLFGLASIPLFHVAKDKLGGGLVTRAGVAYATLWIGALAMRLIFAYGSSHWFHAAVAGFSMSERVPAATYGSAFVLMVLAMIVVRTAAVVVRARRAGAELRLTDSKLLRRLARA